MKNIIICILQAVMAFNQLYVILGCRADHVVRCDTRETPRTPALKKRREYSSSLMHD